MHSHPRNKRHKENHSNLHHYQIFKTSDKKKKSKTSNKEGKKKEHITYKAKRKQD